MRRSDARVVGHRDAEASLPETRGEGGIRVEEGLVAESKGEKGQPTRYAGRQEIRSHDAGEAR